MPFDKKKYPKDMFYLIILNFENGDVIIDKIDSSSEGNIEQYFIDNGLQQKNCQWMTCDELNLKMSI